MRSTHCLKTGAVTFVFRVVISFLLLVLSTNAGFSHGTQTSYCITDQGKIRVWIEHWHGNISPGNVTTALVSIDVTDTNTGITTNYQQIPDGVVWDTTIGNLPDCKGPMTILSSCPGRANVYNDWVYWEFTPPACFVNLAITIREVVGSQSWYFDEACSQLYPVTFSDSFIDCVPPTIACPSDFDAPVDATGCVATVTSGLEPEILFDDCTAVSDLVLNYSITGALTASGSGNANGLSFPKGASTITYSVTDNTNKTSTCSFVLTVVDNDGPTMTCPSTLTLECNLSSKSAAITDWLSTVSATDFCGIASITNDFDPNGFVINEEPKKSNTYNQNPAAGFGSLMLSSLSSNAILNSRFAYSEQVDFKVQEMSGLDKYDYPVKIRVAKNRDDGQSLGNIFITDDENRLMPYWVESQNDNYTDVWVKVPELKANLKSNFVLNYGTSERIEFTKKDVFGENNLILNNYDKEIKPIVLGRGVSNLMFLNETKNTKTETVETPPAMGCNCTATQGAQSFPINALQNAEDDVSFFQYGTPNGASANTGLEMNDAVVLFLYENTLTGEISLFILIDAAGGGNGGRGSIDFFCLPASATLDFSDDPGEITGIFPTVTANWRWANCCTDGALIGNVGCNTTFDFYPNFTSGINSMKWVSGTLANPVFNTFNNFSDPVRIQCGTGQPECCPNANTVNVTDASCPSSMDGSIDLIVDAGGSPYTYLWSNGATTQDLNGVGIGDYTVTVSDKNDCVQIIPVTINSEQRPEFACTVSQTILMDDNTIDITAGGNLMYTVNYSCPDNYTVSCVGCGTYTCADANTTFPVTLTVEDVQGNTDECVVMVTLQNDGPQLTCPDDLTLECDLSGKSASISSWLETATSTSGDLDNIANDFDPNGFVLMQQFLSNDDIAYQSPSKLSVQREPKDYYLDLSSLAVASGNSASGSQTVTFTATDNCGNTTTCTAVINIVDTTEPVIVCPNDITIECGDPNNSAIITNWLDNATANDTCDPDPVVTNNYTASFAGGCDGPTGSRTVTFTAMDCEGNSATCTATITVDDSVAPEFSVVPQDITVGCIDTDGNASELESWLASNGEGVATDDCDQTVSWSSVAGTINDLCGYTFTRDYTFTIADNCGNTATHVATFTVEDTTPPVINFRWQTLTQTCSANNETNLANYLEQNKRATDACSPTADVNIDWVLMSDQESCGGTIHRTYLYTATDACGNTSTDIFEYQTTDVTIPTWANVPGTLVLECGAYDNGTTIDQWIEDVEDSMFDACGGEVTIMNNWDGDLSDGCNQNTTVSWTVTDDCGNSRTLTRTIAVRDTENPVFLNCPDDFTVNVDVDECGSNVIFPTPVAYDQCTPHDELEITQINGPASGSSFPVGTTYVRFRVRDECNREGLCDFFITVVDTDEPSINCPSNIERCTRPNVCTWRSDASVNPITNENCSTVSLEYEVTGATVFTRSIGTPFNRNFNIGTSTVCYFVTDGSGNETTCCFDVIITDCTNPVITCPADILNAACGSTPPASFIATATDNCDATVTVTSQLYNTISACGSTNIEVYQFIATDDAGNTSQCFAQFGTVDVVAPVITTAASDGASTCLSADIDLLGWLNNNGGAEANDACGTVNWSYEFVGGVMTGCSGAPNVTVMFTATDECGNTSTTQADFNVDDSVDPTITCPVDITLECGDAANDAIINAWLGTATTSDNCSDPVITNNFPAGFTASCGGAGAYAVVFTATDDCGNTASCTANVTVIDDTDPVFILSPQNMTVECDADGNEKALNAWLKNNGGASAMDNCDASLDWKIEETGSVELCGNSKTLTYSFLVIDDCDNSSSQTAQFIIEDTSQPSLTIPTALQVECDGSDNATDVTTWIATATATDVCGSASVSSVLFNSENSCGNFEQLTYLFTATDECGNSTTGISSITVMDDTDPTINCPSNLTLNCGDVQNASLIADWLTQATTSDDCSDVVVSHNYTGLFPANCGGSLSVIFTATDDCGNSASCSADIIMQDLITPDFNNCPSDMTINVDVSNCGSNPIFSTPGAQDNCGVTVTQNIGPASGTPFSVGTTLVGFIATDECGNTETCQFNITVVDSADPLVLCPADLFDRCITDGSCALTINDIEPVLGQENCPGFTIAYTITGATSGSGANDASGTSFNIGNSTVCYTLTDAASNTSTCCFDIQVIDCSAPTINCPTDLTVTCDGSGNTSDLNSWLASASASDGCSTPITFENKQYNTISGCGDTNATIYEFIATDAAGNTSVCYAEYAIEDVINPIITTEASDLTVECDGANNSNDIQSWLNNFAGAEATDGCGSITFSHDFSGSLSDECAQTGSITVIFTATDDCGNTATTDAEFTIEDTTDPVITCPESIDLECGDPLNEAVITNWLATASASDVCSDVTFTNDFTTSFSGTCGDAGTYTVTFTATDDCGNSSTCQKTITITDNILPVFEQLPQDLELECAGVANTPLYNNWRLTNGGGVASDECGDVAWSVATLTAIPNCGDTEIIPHVWTITDDCGNISTAMSNVIITDTEAPSIVTPVDMTVECDGLGNVPALDAWLATVSGSDTCGDVTTDYILNNTTSACGGGYVQSYIFTVKDACGNETSDVASFTIDDTTIPTITCPSDLSLECGAIGNDQEIFAWLDSATGADVCSTASITNDFDGSLPADCNGSVTVVFTATDDCGNTATCSSNITMDDTTEPMFINCPGPLTINVDVDACGSNPIFSTPIAEDNCTVTVAQTAGLTSGDTFPVGTSNVEFTATDACGNTDVCQFTITVIDSDVPQIFCPSTTVTQCTDIGFCTWNGDASVAPTTSFENCDDYTITYTITGATTGSGSTTAAGEVFSLGLSTVCYTITDVSGNISTCCFDVLLTDCEAPSLVCPNDLVVECAVSNEVQKNTWLNSAVSSDNCDAAPSIEFTLFNTVSGCGGSMTEQYLITASDLAGNQNTCIISFEVQDNTAPVINSVNPDVTVECDGSGNSAGFLMWLENNGNIADAAVTEFCSDFTWANNFEQVVFTENASCSDDIGFYEVQFWVVDECANESNRLTKRYIIEDTTDPTITVPADITLQCDNPLNEAITNSWLQDVSASDLCDNDVEIANAIAVVNQCGNTNTTTYTFTATDACGNATTQSAQIIIIDTESPLITVQPTDLLLECAGATNDDLIDAWEDSFGGSMAVDNCNSTTLSWSIQDDVAVSGCGDSETVNYVFVVEDDCGNTSTTAASVIITDTTDPVLTLPIDQVEECGAIVVSLTDWIAETSATDDCGEVAISSVLWDTQSGCGSTDTELYLFTATDDCGNATTGIASYTLVDNTDPDITCPANLILECGDEENDQFITAWLQSVISQDVNGCSDVVVTHNYTGGFPDPFTCDGGTGTVVVFTSTDECGNTSTCSANILMSDTEVPYFVDCPSNLVVNVDVDLCTTNVIFSTPIALDNCDEMVAVTQLSGPVSGSAFPLGASLVSFEAEDECGNKSTCTFQITVVDSDTPSISCPSNDVVKCNDNGNCTWLANDDVDPLFNDNCSDLDLVYTITGATIANSATTGTNTVSGDGIVFELGQSTVCYTVTDGTGNTDMCCFDVIVEDCQDPEIQCSDDFDVACGAEDVSGWYQSIAATVLDNCDGLTDLSVDTLLLEQISSCGSTFEKIYLFTVTDVAGNTSTCLATYETDDNIAPVIDTEAMDMTIECNGGNQSSALQAWLNNNAGAEASDACSGPITWSNNFTDDLTTVCGTAGSVVVVFTATDDCGNTSTTDAIFTIEDTTSPALTLPSSITLECNGSLNGVLIDDWLITATAEDICEGSLDVTNDFLSVVQTDLCGETGVTTVTFTVVDACGNSTTDTRTVTIVDTTDPIVESEALDLNLECADPINATAISAWENSFGGAVGSDACSDEALVWSIITQVDFDECGSTMSTLYVFQVEDNCGNTSTTSASINISDSTPPVLTLPEDQVEECGNIIVDLNSWLAEATATDLCGTVSIESVLWNTTSGCGSTDSNQYLFTATDECGNETTGFASYTTQDTSDPTIVCPSDLILECGDLTNDQRINFWLESATATDEFGCNDIEITYTYPGNLPSVDCTGAAGITVTFTATDECGNTDECTAMIIMNDTTVPVFQTCPDDMTVNVDVSLCSTNVVYSTPTAFDACDEDLVITHTAGPASGTPFALGLNTVTFEVEDNCGNTSECSFDITVIDSGVPSIDCPSNDVLVCTDDTTCTWTSDDKTNPIFNDNCPGLIVTYTITGATTATSASTGVNTVAGDNNVFEIGLSQICYTIEDPAGNSSSCCFNVIVEDCESPSLTCNDQIDVACGSENISAWFDGIAATALDNCNALADLSVDTLLLTDFSSCGGTFEKVYLFTVTDQAGNTSTCTAIYETDDLVVPSIDLEASDLTLECNGNGQSTALQAWLNNNGGAVSSDICSPAVTWTNDYVGDLTSTCGTNGTVLVTFTATDQCDNTSTTSATFTIEDTTSPILDLPASISLECGGSTNDVIIQNWISSARAEDSCEGSLSVINDYATAIQTDECGLTGITTILFTVTDACGNSSTDTRTITIVDTTIPEITEDPVNLILECADPENEALIAAWEADFGGSEAIDICSDENLVWSILNTLPFGNCGDTQSTLYIFQVEDNCGNTSTTSASVIINDTTPPVLTVPTDLVVECNDAATTLAMWMATATATDLCGDVEITSYLNNTISDCGGTYREVYIFTATDACGNQTTGTAEYSLEDTTDPEIICPADLVLNCGNPSNDLIIIQWLESATASDPNDCSAVEITYTNPSALPDLDCSGTGGATITWTATDDCGNISTCQAQIIVEDDEIPVFVNCPSDLTINVDVDACTSNPIFSTPIANDNCSVTVSQIANAAGDLLASGTAFPIGVTEVVFLATDICGNTATCTFDITVIDSDIPIVLCPSNTIEVDTDDGVCTWTSDDRVSTSFSVENCPDQTLVYNITGSTTASGIDDAAGEIFELGLSTVCYTLTDASGNESSCCFDVFVMDNEMPVIACPDNVTVATSDVMFGDCLANFDWTHPTIMDNCDLNGTSTLELITQTPNFVTNVELALNPGSATTGIFELGTTILTYIVTDSNGNITTCEWTVTVEDNEVPTITCPVDVTFDINDDCAYTEITDQLNATFDDNCAIDMVVHDYLFGPFANTLAGSSFDIGTTTVTWTAIDESGNSSTCAFDITIEDNDVPDFVNCPSDTLVVGSDVDNCSAFVNWSDPIAIDECGVSVSQTGGPNSGDELAPGFYTVTYVATDANANTSICEFVIHVQDTQIPIVLCPSNDVIVETDLGVCTWTSPAESLTATTALTNCPFDLTWMVTNPDGSQNSGDEDVSGYVFALGTSTVCYDIIESDDIDNNGFLSSQCCFNVIVEDNEKPQVTCPADVDTVTSAGGTGDCLARYEWVHPAPTDNCGLATIFVLVEDAADNILGPVQVNAGESILYDFPIGESMITYEIEDNNGNTTSCAFTVTVADDENPEVDCVANVTVSADDNCQYTVLNDALDASYTDNCNIDLAYHDYIFAPASGTLAGAKFDFGTTEIVWTIVDDFGNASTCTHSITVIDDVAPVITNCPANRIVQDSDSGMCQAVVNFSNIAAIDNCGGYIEIEFMLSGAMTQAWTTGQASGIMYPVGITNVNYRATDQYGNVSEICNFDIEIVDNIDPVAVCQDIEVMVDFNCMATIMPADIDAGSTDNCGIASLMISEDGVNFFDELNFMSEDLASPFLVITLQVTDDYGNTSICQSSVFVVDEIDPMVICQDDIIVQTEPGVCYAMVPNVIPPIDTTDNCMGISHVRQEPLPGLLFGSEVGDSMFVTVIVEDQSGNMDSCEVKLVIEDTEIPQFTNCPRPPVTVAAETDLCSAAVNFSVPTGTDNCGTPTINKIDDTGLDSGDWFPIGTTILSYEIVDGSGNADTCHIKVIVNDLQPPSFNCPEDVVQVNDPGFCGAIVKDIDPENIMDNCTDELTVTFAVDWEGTRDNGGVIEASGEYFQVGNNVVTYCLEDRPTIVISEVTHEIRAAIGTNSIPSYFDQGVEEDYIEITNVGPSTVDVSCLVIEKLIGSSGGVGSFTVPFNTLMAPGAVMVIHVGPGTDSPVDLYFNMDVGGSNAGDAAGYALMYGECIIDVVALNGFNPIGAGDLLTVTAADWSGAIASDAGTAGVYRPFTFDGNNNFDWAVVDDINPGSIGKVNQDFDVYPDTGLTSSLQSKCGTKVCCTFTVEIFDVEPPTMVCPLDMVINTSDNGTGDCTSSTSWKHPDIDDNCGTTKYCMTVTTPDSMVVENCTIIPGVTFVDEFEVGVTTIGYLVEDEAGNQTTCSFTITVLDDEDPQFTCPSDLFVQLGAGECFVNVFNQIDLFETDNCGDMTMISNPDMDGQFNEGDNVVNIVIEDAAGNQRNCSFMITVAAYVPTDTEMACQGTVNVSLNADCEAIITPEMILVAGDYGCLDDLQISLSETHGGDPIPTSPMVTSDHINMSLIVTIYNPVTGNSCWGTVLVEDKLVPEIECPMDMTVSCAEGLNPANIGMPTLLSCESSTTMIFTDEIIDNGMCGTPRAIHTRTWIVTDESGNSSTCSHTITVERLESSLVVCPLNYDGVDNPELDCDAVSTNPLLIHPDNTGRPTINGANVLEAEYCPLSINMEDELFDLCDGTYDILRTWRIYDPCKPVVKDGPDRNPIHCTQVIRVRDNTAPVITCPADMTFSVNDNSCRADIQFPAAEIIEACGTVGVQLISPFGSLNTNGGVIADIAIGTFQVRYIATDGCGNQSECKMNVSVMDEIQPVVVCNPDVIVSLNNTGVAEVFAQAFDAGSTDNCTLESLVVRRMTTNCGVEGDLEFGESVTFCCADVDSTVMVMLRAYDAVGNFNECMVEVVIDDKQEAEITCPADIVVDCGSTNYQDTSVTGVATFTDNCTGNLGTAAHTDQEFIDQCGNGYVLRTWTVGTASCVQRIDLVDPEPFYIADTTCGNLDPDDGIIWPCDVEIESCSQIQDPSVTGEVQVFDDNCSLTGIDYEDQVFTLEADACFKVVRTWKIIDWCTYDANTGAGYWEYDQVIKIINSMPPVFDSCATVEACTFNDSCSADVTATVSASDDCSATAELSYSYQLDIDNDGTFNKSGTGSSITETLAIGTHSVLWAVEDGCGNVSVCTQLIEVKDCKAPSAYCINGLSTSLESGTGMVTIWASDFDNGSEDNCTAQSDLSISFSSDTSDGSMTFSCSDLPNGQEETIVVQMWVTDAGGNQSFCTTSILVQDVHDACIDVLLPRADIAGRIMTEEHEGINEVVINMENMDTQEPYDVMTDTIGVYEFGESMPTEYLYAIKPLKDDDDRNGLTALDLLGIQKHILRLDTLDSPYKIIAADVNGSGKISSIDLIELQKLLLGVYNKLPNNTSWRFVNKDFVFVDPTDPWPFEEERYIDVLMNNEMKEDFVGVKVGDVNGTVEPNMLRSEYAESRNVIWLKAKDRLLQSGQRERIDIAVSQDMDINALYFTLEALNDEVTITDVASDLLPLSESDYATFDKDRVATMLWYDVLSTKVKEGKNLLTIELVVSQDMLLSEAIQINSSIIDAGVVETGDMESSLQWDIETLEHAFEVTQNTPNPFVDKTAIDITLSEAADIVISVYDALGKKVYAYSEYHTASFTHYFNSTDLGDSPGIYTYEVTNGDRVISQSMILIK